MIAPAIVGGGLSLLGSLFGGGGTTQSSKNVNRGLITDQFSGAAGQTGNATDAIAALLGIGGDPEEQQKAFDTWKGSTGYQFGLDQGSQAITGNSAAKGLLNSGSTLKALDQFGTDYASTKYQDYLDNIINLGQLGLGAGGLVANVGQVSKSKSGGKK